MKLNRPEKLVVNNPLRTLVMRRWIAPMFERMGGRLDGARVLEVGCGRGSGIEVIFEHFGAATVSAFDLDPGMVALARRRLRRYTADRLRLGVGDVTSIDEPPASFDAVFDFAIVHHVPEWQQAVREISRVLRPGGLFYFEEVTSKALDRWAYRAFFDHPKENRFGARQFVDELETQGISVGTNFTERFFGDFVIGVGKRG